MSLLRRGARELYRVYGEDDFWAGPGSVPTAEVDAQAVEDGRARRVAGTAILLSALGALAGVVLVGLLAQAGHLRRSTPGRLTGAAEPHPATAPGIEAKPGVSTAPVLSEAREIAAAPRASGALAPTAARRNASGAARRVRLRARPPRSFAAGVRPRLLAGDAPRSHEAGHEDLGHREPTLAAEQSERREAVGTPDALPAKPRLVADATVEAPRSKPGEFGFER